MGCFDGVYRKLDEGSWFLALLDRIGSGNAILQKSLDRESTYVTAALLNSCYAVLQHLEKRGVSRPRGEPCSERQDLIRRLRSEIKKVYQSNPDLYRMANNRAGDTDYGLRHLTVHHRVVAIHSRTATKGPPGTAMFGELMFGECRQEHSLYTNDPATGMPIEIVPRMRKHIEELRSLSDAWASELCC